MTFLTTDPPPSTASTLAVTIKKSSFRCKLLTDMAAEADVVSVVVVVVVDNNHDGCE
jgi:hypothetical protein